MKSRFVLFIFCLLIWIGINWTITGSELIIGIIASIIVALCAGDIFVRRPHVFMHIKRYFWLISYIGLLLIEVIKANIDIVYRLLGPEIPLNSGIVKVKTKIKSHTGLTLLANSVTFSPGTCTFDIDADAGYLYVHWMDVESQNVKAATERIVGKFENILQRIFD